MIAAALQGSLSSFKLPDVLSLLGKARKSGTLTLRGEGRQSYVLFKDGALVFAGSDQEKFRLGAILLRKKKISKEQWQQIDDAMRRDGLRFGKAAVLTSVLTEDELRDFLKVQVSEIVFDAFVWHDGTFAFSEELQIPDFAVTISIDLQNLIMEGARRISEWEQCIKLLPDSSVVFRVVAAPKDDKVTLTSEEWKILFMINGQRTLAELANEGDDDPLRVYRIVYGLLANRLIEEVRRAPAPHDTWKLTSESGDATIRQTPPLFSGDATIRDISDDDTSLLLSNEARLSYRDVARPLVAQLTIGNGEEVGRVIPLTEPEYLIGRQQDNTIQLPDIGVSGRHARIYRSGDSYLIEDMKSRNGTWVNGERVSQGQLRSGDELRMGATDLRYEVLLQTPSVAARRD